MPDIVVVGGGLTGLMTALTLSYSPFQVTYLRRYQSNVASEKIRTTTISAAGKRMLETLGVWQQISDTPTPIEALKVGDGELSSARRTHRGKAFRLEWQDRDEPMAFVVTNASLLTALENQMRHADVETITGHTVTKFISCDNQVNMTVTNDRKATDQVICDLVVGCDGANSTLGKFAGIKRHVLRHKQTAVVALITTERPHGNTAFQRFLESGPIALMPMGKNLMSLVWTLPKQKAIRYQACNVADFNRTCKAAFGDELGLLSLQSDRLIWPLQPAFVANPTADNLILAGDAAHVIHPLAGQGYNLALGDAAVLLEILCHASARGLPASHISVLANYRQKRRLEVGAMSFATIGLNSLFSAMPPRFIKIADLGMSLLNQSTSKYIFSEIARGGKLAPTSLFSGNLPKQERDH